MEKLIKQFKKYWFFFGLLLLTLTIVGIDSWTKYVTERQEDGIAKAVEMFFTSDVLKEDGASGQEPDYTVVDLGNDDPLFTFELRNYPDSLRYTERAISYKVTADNDQVLFGIEDSPSGSNELVGTIPAPVNSQNQQSQKITLHLADNFWSDSPSVQEKEFIVTATTTAPYENYKISAKFLIKKAAEGYRVSIEDSEEGSAYTKVTIDSNDSIATGNLILTWDDSVVVPDQTNPIFDTEIGNANLNIFDGNGKTIKINPIVDGGSVTFLMLKYDTSVSYNDGTYTNAFTISP